MSSEYNASLLSYRTAMSLAKGMLSREIISEEEYHKIDKITAADTRLVETHGGKKIFLHSKNFLLFRVIMTKKYGVSSSTIYR